jgi:LruC domain-containing protein
MRNLATRTNIILLGIAFFLPLGCLKENFNELKEQTSTENPDYSGFDFQTVHESMLTIKTLLPDNTPYPNAYLEIYQSSPLNEDGVKISGIASELIYKDITNSNGQAICYLNVADVVDSVYLLSHHAGLPNVTSVALTDSSLEVEIGGDATLKSTRSISAAPDNVSQMNGYYVLGGWNFLDVPDYLEADNDALSQDFLNDVTASLPENIPLTQSHPQYLNQATDANLIVEQDCEIWVTFVHEGAGWTNTPGYYTYPEGQTPETTNDIANKTIIFPNTSMVNSNGGLVPGNEVQLYYLDTATMSYSNIFPAGTTVGWFLVTQGWGFRTVRDGNYTHYSDIHLNVESDPSLQKHNVLLFDEARELLLLGFEDIRRDANSDNDFNDAVFYVTASPISAIKHEIYQPIDQPTDTDGDGTSDVFDQYPDDAEAAFNNYYPAQNTFVTLVFEDLWPYKGDYDFNDLVLSYNFNQVTNARNQITGINTQVVVRAIGASYHNAFGIELNTPANNVASVSGQQITKGYLNIQENGTESGHDNACIIFFDDAFNFLPYSGEGLCVNTYPEYPHVTPDTFEIAISFNNPVDIADLGTAPYNPFLVIDRDRGVEVHLPNKPPTQLANLELLRTGQDNSDAGSGKYYVSDIYLPWAINIPTSFDYPAEKKDITQTYLMFNEWATSQGYNSMDWYMDYLGYRNTENIYS